MMIWKAIFLLHLCLFIPAVWAVLWHFFFLWTLRFDFSVGFVSLPSSVFTRKFKGHHFLLRQRTLFELRTALISNFPLASWWRISILKKKNSSSLDCGRDSSRGDVTTRYVLPSLANQSWSCAIDYGKYKRAARRSKSAKSIDELRYRMILTSASASSPLISCHQLIGAIWRRLTQRQPHLRFEAQLQATPLISDTHKHNNDNNKKKRERETTNPHSESWKQLIPAGLICFRCSWSPLT